MQAPRPVQVVRWDGVMLNRYSAAHGLFELELVTAQHRWPLTVRVGDSRSWITLTPPDLDDPVDTSNEVCYGVWVESCSPPIAERIEAALRQLPLDITSAGIGREGDGLYWCGDHRDDRLILSDTRKWAALRHTPDSVLRDFGTGPEIEIEALRRGCRFLI